MIDTFPEGEFPPPGTRANILMWRDEDIGTVLLRGPDWAFEVPGVEFLENTRDGLYVMEVELDYRTDSRGYIRDSYIKVLRQAPVPVPSDRQLRQYKFHKFIA